MSPRPGIDLANLTDTGCRREQNEDYYCYFEPDNDADFRRKGRLAVVADGMGGHEGGQLASSIAVETLRSAYDTYSGDDPHEALLNAFKAANYAIRECVREHPDLDGMGTTCTAAVICDHHLS